MPDWPPPLFVQRPGGYRSAWFSAGPEDGVPLMLCHGLAASGLQFVADAAFYAANGYRVIVPDLRGHGRSTCPEERADADFSIPALAGDLIAILDAEGLGAVHWVGNSLGGILALEILGRTPERLKSLVTFGTAYSLDLPTALVTLGAAGYRLLGTKITAMVGAPMTCRDPDAQAIVRQVLEQVDVDAAIRVGAAVHRYDLRQNAAGYEGPILMIRGERDRAINNALGPTLEVMVDRPNFQLIDLPEAGHCANLDRPGAVRKLVADFVTAAGV